jgi:HPr kinase/phosphorylase
MQWPDSFPKTVHATSLSTNGRAVLCTGPSGSGKSTLAWQLIGLGAQLISDDLTELDIRNDCIWACRPPNAPKEVLLEARGVGLFELPATATATAPLALVIDLSNPETARLPDPRFLQIGPASIRVFHKIESPAFPAIILQYLSQSSPNRVRHQT